MTDPTQQLEANKRVIRQFGEAWASGDVDALDDLVAEDCVLHVSGVGPLHGREEVEQTVQMYQAAFSDLAIEIHDLVAEDDKVVKHFTGSGTHRGEFLGIEATGEYSETPGFSLYRLDDGKIVEATMIGDFLALLQQLGVDELPDV